MTCYSISRVHALLAGVNPALLSRLLLETSMSCSHGTAAPLSAFEVGGVWSLHLPSGNASTALDKAVDEKRVPYNPSFFLLIQSTVHSITFTLTYVSKCLIFEVAQVTAAVVQYHHQLAMRVFWSFCPTVARSRPRLGTLNCSSDRHCSATDT